MTTMYQIKIRGQLDPSLSAWFGDLAISHTPEGNTLLTGTIIDQAAMYGVLTRCRDAGVTLISINPINEQAIEPSGEKRNTMSEIKVAASKVINARPEQVYNVFADYAVAHNAVLPKPYFDNMTIEKGGRGAGTVVQVHMKAFGKEYGYHLAVTEPVPGHTILEKDTESGMYTTFVMEPVQGGQQTKVTITTFFPAPGGLVGWLQGLIQPSLVRPIYLKEIDNVENYIRANQAALTTS